MSAATGRCHGSRRHLYVETLESRRLLDARVRITEFVADNENGLRDDDRDRSDWIQIDNLGDSDAQLEGWYLTDNPTELTKWRFPSLTLMPNESRIVFASGKDRVTSPAMHANFRLSRQGEFLALVKPDGTTIEQQFAPTYPRQHTDVAFGLPQTITTTTAIGPESPLRYFVPTEENGAEPGQAWWDPDFDDAAWLRGSGGIGFGSTVSDFVDIDVRDAVLRKSSSLYVRIPFTVTDAAAIHGLTLQMQYDDGFVAYLNGHEVARANVTGAARFDSTADENRGGTEVRQPDSITLATAAESLHVGVNVLAIHGINVSTSSSDMLVRAGLQIHRRGPILSDAPRFFATPTPLAPNGELSYAGKVEDLELTIERGFFDEPQEVLLATSTVGAALAYTTDGSVPTSENGTVVTSIQGEAPVIRLNVAHTTTLRAVAIKEDHLPSAVATHSYVFLDDIIRQSADGSAPPGWPDRRVNGQVFDYGMDPDVVNDPEYGPMLQAALRDIPSFSIVTDSAHLFDRATGIYVNGEAARGRNDQWERPTSVELIHSDGTQGFQIDAGIRLRGGASRRDDNPKHAFRLFFREEYGSTKLHYPLFGNDGVDEFDNIDLRTAQAPSWTWLGNVEQHTMLREVFSRDTQRDMGQPYTRSQYYHLYLNGQYWGIYQTQERAEASFGESYFGGDKEDFDVIKVEPFPHHVRSTDGDIQAWRDLWEMARAGFETDEAYRRAQGLNADGTRNPNYPVLLDVDNLIDYMIVIFYTGDLDAPISNFGSNVIANNFYAIRDRTEDRGFAFFAHDAEWTLMDVSTNRLGPWPGGRTFDQANPQWLHQQLMQNDEYRLRFADRVQMHLFHGGPLTTAAALHRVQSRADQLELAIIAESARWGDHRRPSRPLTKVDWEQAVQHITDRYIPQRNDVLLSQLRDARLTSPSGPRAPLFPVIDAPRFSHVGGRVARGFSLELDSDHEIFFTTDGTDPRFTAPEIDAVSLIGNAANLRYVIPQDDSLGRDWTQIGFDDSSWSAGKSGLGYGSFEELIATNIEAELKDVNTSVYVRIPFSLDQLDFDTLDLSIYFDDGVVAYLNGTEISRRNAPVTISWNSRASATNRTSQQAVEVNLADQRHLLRRGENVLALHGMNRTPGSDFLLSPQLLAGRVVSIGLSPQARAYTGPVVIGADTVVSARAFSGQWSALSQGRFTTSPSPLRVSELMYHPSDPTPAERAAGFTDANDFEYIELWNTSHDEAIALEGVTISRAVDFVFPQLQLRPREHVVVARHAAAFRHRYGDQPFLAGEYSLGQLSNAGETLRMTDLAGLVIQEFQYKDDWHPETDGNGLSLVSIAAVDDLFAWSQPTGWRASHTTGGTPAAPPLLPGDANGDGVFDSRDLVQVFRIGEYDDGRVGNSTWEDGDWNGDDEFDSSDLVTAFTHGTYRA